MNRFENRLAGLLLVVASNAAFAQSATTPGEVTMPYPTLNHISVEWAISGDSNLNGVVQVRYRPVGASAWQTAMPLFRVPAGANQGFSWDDRHSGSLFDLQPETTYQIELSLDDPDGGSATRTVNATTRGVPRAMPGAPVTVVTPASIGAALQTVSPGDILLMSPGQYDGFLVERDGSEGRPIVLRGTPGAIIDGELGIFSRRHILLDQLTVNGRIRFNGSDHVTITRCRVIASDTEFGSNAINAFGRSEYAYIADNTLVGTAVWEEATLGASGNNRGEGVAISGPGHVIRNNRVSGFRDNISLLEDSEAIDQFSIDISNNELSEGADDAIEADFCFHNCRVLRNRVTNSFVAFSSQPSLGGPSYFIRNSAYNIAFTAFKLLRSSEGDVLLHNTVVKNGDALGMATSAPVSRLLTRNNLFIGGPGGRYNGFNSGIGRVIRIQSLVIENADLNFDALGSTRSTFEGRFGTIEFNGLNELRTLTTETDAVQVDLSAFASEVAYPQDPLVVYPGLDLRLAPGSNAIDIGQPLANVNDGFIGAAPDAGAYEVGQALPVYGPRGCAPLDTDAQIERRQVRSQPDLIEAIEHANAHPELKLELEVVNPVVFAPLADGARTAVPAVTGQVALFSAAAAPPTLTGGGAGTDFRLTDVTAGGCLGLKNVAISRFHTLGPGAALRAVDGATIRAETSVFSDNVSADNGGAIAASGATLSLLNNLFERNAARRGGAVHGETLRGLRARFNRFVDNASSELDASQLDTGMDTDAGTPGEPVGNLAGNVFTSVTAFGSGQQVELASGDFELGHNSAPLVGTGTFVNYRGFDVGQAAGAALLGNAVGPGGVGCLNTDPVSGEPFSSLGGNVFPDTSCPSNGPGDLASADPGIVAVLPQPGIAVLAPDSVAIDLGREGATGSSELPCPYKDIRGLGRPQDGNGDGRYECDAGAWELQGGDELGAAQTAAFFDPARPGEGFFVEMLGGDLAFIANFTYLPGDNTAGDGLAWFVGIGRRVGNSLVVDDFLRPVGGVFGPGFDPAAISRRREGALSLVFSDCLAGAVPGRASFEADPESAFGDLYVSAARLTDVVDCAGDTGPGAHLSGSFFDPARDGEGIFVQHLTGGGVVVIWYTFDPDGRQFWTISGEVALDGQAVTAQMLYPASPTAFGAAFDPGEVVLEPWGTLTLTYSGCDALRLDYASVVDGFGSGGYDYQRLTRPLGTSCPTRKTRSTAR